MTNIMKDLSFKLEDMDIEESVEINKEKERKLRSEMMDQKVAEITRKREEEERQECERRRIVEGKRKEEEEARKMQIIKDRRKKINETKKIKQNEAVQQNKQKIDQLKEDELKKRGITKLPEKFNDLVGEYKNRLKNAGDGSCQATAKAAILLQDPSRGPELAMAKNGYIIEHWEKFFSPFFAFPHEAKLRGGEVKIFKTENEFLEFLILNPKVSYMWADHHQLLVTANQYNTVVQVLTINENGEGSLLQETIRPNPVLSPYSLLPQTRSDGEAVDIPEVWLTYTGGNHYEALLKDDHPLITEGSLKEREMLHKSNQPDDVKEINQSNVTENLCDKCQFSFSSKAALVKHSETSGHSQGVKIVRESKIACDSTNLVTELLDFELTEAQDGNDLKEERIAHKDTKKSYEKP